MPASAELRVDTSVAVALAVADHEHHEPTMRPSAGAGWVSPDTPRSWKRTIASTIVISVKLVSELLDERVERIGA